MLNEYEPSPEQKKYEPLFKLVEDKTNWKNPINSMVDPQSLRELGATKTDLGKAITFYTGSVATIGRDPQNPRMLRVRAIGYYAAIGA